MEMLNISLKIACGVTNRYDLCSGPRVMPRSRQIKLRSLTHFKPFATEGDLCRNVYYVSIKAEGNYS